MNNPSPKAEVMSESVLKQEVPARPYRYLTSEQAELLPLPLQLERLREINQELVSTHNHMVIQGAKDDREREALREEIANLTLLSDSQLANQERLTKELAQAREDLRASHDLFKATHAFLEQSRAELATERANQERLVGELAEAHEEIRRLLGNRFCAKRIGDWP